MVGEVFNFANESMRCTLGEALHAPRQSHLEDKRRTTSTHRRRGWRWEGMAPKMAWPRLLDTSRQQAAMRLML